MAEANEIRPRQASMPTLADTEMDLPRSASEDGSVALDRPRLSWSVDLGDELRAMTTFELWYALNTGDLPPEIRVWRLGREAWSAAREVPELACALRQTELLMSLDEDIERVTMDYAERLPGHEDEVVWPAPESALGYSAPQEDWSMEEIVGPDTGLLNLEVATISASPLDDADLPAVLRVDEPFVLSNVRAPEPFHTPEPTTVEAAILQASQLTREASDGPTIEHAELEDATELVAELEREPLVGESFGEVVSITANEPIHAETPEEEPIRAETLSTLTPHVDVPSVTPPSSYVLEIDPPETAVANASNVRRAFDRRWAYVGAAAAALLFVAVRGAKDDGIDEHASLAAAPAEVVRNAVANDSSVGESPVQPIDARGAEDAAQSEPTTLSSDDALCAPDTTNDDCSVTVAEPASEPADASDGAPDASAAKAKKTVRQKAQPARRSSRAKDRVSMDPVTVGRVRRPRSGRTR